MPVVCTEELSCGIKGVILSFFGDGGYYPCQLVYVNPP